jgi:hypothetical protein
LGNNIFDLFFSKSLEVVWHESVWGKLGFSCCEILLHNITHIGPFDFRSILSLLVSEPLGLSVSLLLGKHLVVILHFVHHVLLFHGGLVFENLSHLSDSSGLVGILLFFVGIILIIPIVLSLLLLDPFFLQLCICGFSGSECYINKSIKS